MCDKHCFKYIGLGSKYNRYNDVIVIPLLFEKKIGHMLRKPSCKKIICTMRNNETRRG